MGEGGGEEGGGRGGTANSRVCGQEDGGLIINPRIIHVQLYIYKLYMYKLFIHRKNRFSIFPSPAGMSLTKLSLGGNHEIIPTQGEFGKRHPGWGREYRIAFFTVTCKCTVHNSYPVFILVDMRVDLLHF